MDGAGLIISQLIHYYYDKKKPVTLICLEKNFSFDSIPSDIPVFYLSEATGKVSSLRKFISLPLLAQKLKERIVSENIATVQSYLQRANYVNILAKLIGAGHDAQIVNTDIISGYYHKGLFGRINLVLIQLLYDKADMIILKSKAMQTDMRQLFEFRVPQKILPNPFDFDTIDQQSNLFLDAMFFGFNENKIYITALGYFERLQNFDILIKAFEKTSHSVPQAELILIGRGPELKPLIRLSKKYNIYERVAFVQGEVNSIGFLKRSHIFVLPSSFEGFPNALIEAMICHIPVISTDCPGGPREILAPNTNVDQQLEQGVEYAAYGVLVPVRHVDALSEAMTRLCLDATVRSRYAQNSRARAMTFHKDQILENYKQIFYHTRKKEEDLYDTFRNESYSNMAKKTETSHHV